ncbi:SGNH/GDSL hydrolase family protein [Streptomyces sp. NPDC021096]|uniref:golvesin C-terminal-like domain-containing protein n=1 Tax=Streptomyces sp. NPDC021096 TaxID=3154792 RepID=UPI0033FA4DF6
MRFRRRARVPIAAAAAALMVAGLTQGSVAAAWAADGKPSPTPAPAADTKGKAGLAVEPSQRAGILGKDYKKSTDHAWTTSGDGDGFHLLVADEKDGFTWRTAATLSEPGFDTDAWIGNACVTGSGKRAVVAYAPRTFTNKADLMHRGAFTAVVDLGTGAVNKLGLQASLAHFSPGCGIGESAVLSQYAGEDKNATRLVKVDAATGATAKPVELEGQITSAVPATDGKILAADAARVVKIDDKSGKRTPVVKTNGIPFLLKPDADGGLVYMDRPAAKAAKGLAASTAVPQGAVNRVSAGEIAKADAAKNRATTLATGKLTSMDLSSTPDGTVFITGETTAAGKLPSTVKRPEVPKDSHPTVRGRAMVTETVWADGKDSRIRPEEALTARTAKIKVKSLGTGKSAQFEVPPTSSGSHAAEGRELSPALATAKGGSKPAAKARSLAAAAGSPNQVVEAERYCSVPRNDPRKMAMQPKPRQVEWAVDQTITGNLNKHISRSADWKNLGMGAYQPQSLFPLTPLEGGGRVPAQVMLGITAQESNMWQATRLAVPGVSANPLIGNYYGVGYASDGQQTDPWKVNWDEADCGYGITQATDGMRIAGHEKKGETALSPLKQEAIALDYTANIAAGVNILIEKWNKTRAAGMTVNGGDPKYIENWFFALWAYNAGFYPKEDAAKNKGVWGVGFTNNPANPLWKANRTPFLENANGKDDYSHAKHPQDWPYQEKVLGWAGHPLEGLESPGKMVSGFRPAGWTTNADRTTVKPKESLFCTSANSCDPSKIADLDSNDEGKGACTRKDLHCFWNQPVQWKDCGRMAQCGTEILRFNDTYKEEADGDAYPPQCTAEQPSMHDTLIVDNVPNGTPSTRCGSTYSNGTFSFDFGGRGDGTYPSKIDTHQLAAGFGGHFYFSHTRLDVPGSDQWKITGTWKLNQAINGWTRVMVHMPDHGAHTRQAKYVIDTGKGTFYRVAQQRTGENRWVDLGVFEMAGTPKVSLSTGTQDGDSTEDIAWDAVGFQKLPGKPKNFIVAMGDSYSSGEGASKSGGGDYYSETDNNGKNGNLRAACHRSKYAWSRQAKLPGANASIGNDADLRDSDMDYHMIACSGARTYNITEKGQYGELPQIQQGYLDKNTTLVTISIGGNDSEFTKVFQECFKSMTCETQDKDERALIKDTVRPAITNTLDKINELAPNAKIVLMGYPPLLSNNAKCLNLGILSPNVGINMSESMWLNGIADFLSENMLAAAKASKGKVTFSDPKEFFKNQGICGSPETIHGLVTDMTPGDKPMASWGPLDFGISAQSFHPKIEGARNYANSLEATLKTMG